MAATGPAGDAQIMAHLTHQGTAAPHLLAWVSLGFFAVMLWVLWRDHRRPGVAWWRSHDRRRR